MEDHPSVCYLFIYIRIVESTIIYDISIYSVTVLHPYPFHDKVSPTNKSYYSFTPISFTACYPFMDLFND